MCIYSIKENICNRVLQSGSELPEYVAPLLRNGGSQSPDRWLKEHRNNHEESAEPVTMYEYDYNEIIEDIGVLDIDDVKTNPEKYLNYKKAVEKTDKERIAELEAMNAELYTTVDSILTDVLPTLMGA